MWAVIPIAWRFGIMGLMLLAIVGGGTAIYFKIGHNAVLRERAKVEQEKQNAIQKVDRAKDILRAICDKSPDNCVSDDWLRD